MAATVEQNEDEKEKLSPFDRAARKFGDYFKRQGLGARDIPAAIVVHELLGLLIAASAWAVSLSDILFSNSAL